MTQDERNAILQANQKLLARRQSSTGPQPISRVMPAVEVAAQGDIEAYFEALHTGAVGTVTESCAIEGSRALWDSFDSDRHPVLQRAVKTIAGWYHHQVSAGGGLVLAGNYGCGKTHLAQAIHKLYGFGSVFWNEIKLIEVIQGGYGGGGRDEEGIYHNTRRAKLLVYDDLGAYQTTNLDWLQGVYYKLFDGRQEAGLATLITTNLALRTNGSMPFEERVGGRVFSRLIGQLGDKKFFVDLFSVPDYRKRNF